MSEIYAQHDSRSKTGRLSASEMEHIIQDSLVQMEYHHVSIDDVATYWGLDCLTLYKNIQLYQSENNKH